MGKNKDIRKHLKSLQRQVQDHREKIENELERDVTDFDAISHWEHEITAWEEKMKRLRRRLGKEG